MTDTIIALSSGQPPAAIAVIRTSGPKAFDAAIELIGPLPPVRRASVRAIRDPRTGECLDQALVLCFAADGSATGEETVEYQCHGGRAVVAAVIDALTSLPGIRVALPGEFTRRALANGRLDLTEAEGLADLLQAETQSQRRAALALSTGALSRQVEQWRSQLVDLSARAEAAIDYVGDEDETAIDIDLMRAKTTAVADELREWLSRPRSERLRSGVRVVVAGPANAGKSSLINALAGEDRAIVTPVAGTTRDAIEVPVSLNGTPVILVDTAGFRETSDEVEQLGVRRAHLEVEGADFLLWMGAASDAPSHPECLVVRSKADQGFPDEHGIDLSVSSTTGQNLDVLLTSIAERSRSLLPPENAVALNRRHAALLEDAIQTLEDPQQDVELLAEQFRHARQIIDSITGRAGVEEMLDELFSRFCLGK